MRLSVLLRAHVCERDPVPEHPRPRDTNALLSMTVSAECTCGIRTTAAWSLLTCRHPILRHRYALAHTPLHGRKSNAAADSVTERCSSQQLHAWSFEAAAGTWGQSRVPHLSLWINSTEKCLLIELLTPDFSFMALPHSGPAGAWSPRAPSRMAIDVLLSYRACGTDSMRYCSYRGAEFVRLQRANIQTHVIHCWSPERENLLCQGSISGPPFLRSRHSIL